MSTSKKTIPVANAEAIPVEIPVAEAIPVEIPVAEAEESNSSGFAGRAKGFFRSIDPNEEPPKLRVVDKPKNSAIIGKYISQKFKKKYGDSIKDAGKDMQNGFNYVLDNHKNKFVIKIQETFIRVLTIMTTVSINSNEINFKRIFLTKILEKLENNKALDNSPDDVLSTNIIHKLKNIINNYLIRGGDGETLTSEMECFVSNHTNEMIESYLNPNVDIQTVSDEIVHHLQDSIQTHFSNPNIRMETCNQINESVNFFMGSILDIICEWGDPQETFYVLLDDSVVQGFIQSISKKDGRLKTTLDNKATLDVDKTTNIIKFLNNIDLKNVKSMSPPSALDKINTRLASLLGSMLGSTETTNKKGQVGGGDNLSPSDFYLDDILANIANDAYDDMKKTPIDIAAITTNILAIVNNSLLKLQTNANINTVIKEKVLGFMRHMFGCLFGLFNDKMKLHLMANHIFIDNKDNIDSISTDAEKTETSYTGSLTKLINPVFLSEHITRNYISVSKPPESLIFNTTPQNADKAVNRSVFDIMIEPMYGAMASNQTQTKIQKQMVDYIQRIFLNLIPQDKKNVLTNYIYLPGSMAQMVLSRAKQLSKGKSSNIQSFVLFYLLKKYLYWGAGSTSLMVSVNPRIAQFAKRDKPTPEEYMNEFNKVYTSNTVKQTEVNNLMSTKAAVERVMSKPVDKISSLASGIKQEWEQDRKRSESRQDQRRIDNETQLKELGNTPKSVVKRRLPTKEEIDEAAKSRTTFGKQTQKLTRYQKTPRKEPTKSTGGKRTRKRRLHTRRRTRKH